MVVIAFAVGGFSAIPFAYQKLKRGFCALCGTTNKVRIWIFANIDR